MEDSSVRARAGAYLGQLEPIGGLVWRWPFAQMEIGDWFTVDPEQKTQTAVKQYAYDSGIRLKRKFDTTFDPNLDKIVVTRLDETLDDGSLAAARREVKARQAVLVGGDGDKYLGVLQPPEKGQWIWPMAIMEPGQFFHVAHTDRHQEFVRSHVDHRARALGMALSVTGNDPEFPGFCRIEYVDAAKRADETRDLDYKGINAILMRSYGLDFDQLNAWHQQDLHWQPRKYQHLDYKDADGSQFVFDLQQKTKPRNDSYVVKLDWGAVFGLKLGEDYIEVTGLPPNTSHQQWMARLEPQVDPFA